MRTHPNGSSSSCGRAAPTLEIDPEGWIGGLLNGQAPTPGNCGPLEAWHNLPVDFARAHGLVASFLREAGAPCAVIGGVAVAAYGYPRTTLDLDLVTESAVRQRLVSFLESRGFETLYNSTGFSNHLHAEPALGRIDVMYVSGRTAELLFAGARSVDGPAGTSMTVPSPEHLIAMKVHAMKHAPERTWQEMLDIAHLVTLPGVDRGLVRTTFEKAGLTARWEELARGF